jgi:hypothetical protein
MIFGFLLLTLLLVCTGGLMMISPGRFAATCEAFAAAGNLPSLLPQSVKRALLQVRVIGGCCVLAGIVLTGGAMGTLRALLAPAGIGLASKSSWLIVPAALGIAAGYGILAYGSDWVDRTFRAWADHPLVPQEIIVALTWEIRIAGVAFTLFGLGACSIWIRAIFR